MGYTYRINGTKQLDVHIKIEDKQKSSNLRIFLYKLLVTISSGSKSYSFTQFAFSDIENETFKIRKGHVDNVVQNIAQIYNNYIPNKQIFVENNGLTMPLKNGIVTEKEIREHLRCSSKLKKKLDNMLESNEFYIDDKYLNVSNYFTFETFGTLFKSKDKLHPDVIGVYISLRNAKHNKENSFMKDNYEIMRCDKINIHSFVEPYFGFEIKK